MPKTKPSSEIEVLHVNEINSLEIKFCVIGISPMIMNRFQQKAWQELLLPSQRKNSAERMASLKHDPIAEFRGAVYRNRDPNSPAYAHIPSGAFKGALASAALDIPGATKAKIERLTAIVDVNIDLYGIPNVLCSMVRNSDMNRTPDVRTRPIFPEWACMVRVKYIQTLLTERTVVNLFQAAGQIVGIGDWRPQKGGSFGTFRCAGEDDADYQRIVSKQGRKAQEAALATPIFYDDDTAELLAWFEKEILTRERSNMLESSGKRGKRDMPDAPITDETIIGNIKTNSRSRRGGRNASV